MTFPSLSTMNDRLGKTQSTQFTQATQCMRLFDAKAPYRGVWALEDDGSGLLRAFHSTYRHDGELGCGCLIEQRYFPAHGSARQFVRHLCLHGWDVVEVSAAAHVLLP